VREDVGVGTTGLLQSIGENSQGGIVQQAGGEVPVVVGGLCEFQHGGRQPGGGEGDEAEGVAEKCPTRGYIAPPVRTPADSGDAYAVIAGRWVAEAGNTRTHYFVTALYRHPPPTMKVIIVLTMKPRGGCPAKSMTMVSTPTKINPIPLTPKIARAQIGVGGVYRVEQARHTRSHEKATIVFGWTVLYSHDPQAGHKRLTG
jgi:hypothetical protein